MSVQKPEGSKEVTRSFEIPKTTSCFAAVPTVLTSFSIVVHLTFISKASENVRILHTLLNYILSLLLYHILEVGSLEGILAHLHRPYL